MPESKTEVAPIGLGAETNFEELIERHQKRIYNLAYQYLRSPEEAEDVTQETFLRAYRNREGFRGESSIKTWLTRIAINLCLDVLRSKKRRRVIPWPHTRGSDEGDPVQAQEFPDQEQDLEADAANRDLRNKVYKAMDMLSPQQRTVFILRHLQDMSLKEVVESTGLSEGTVKSQLFRGVRKIRRELEGA
jgi:RNA polymerase sigma-70 factor (ECF subfamily)